METKLMCSDENILRKLIKANTNEELLERLALVELAVGGDNLKYEVSVSAAGTQYAQQTCYSTGNSGA